MSKVIDNIEDIASIDSKSTISYVDSKPTGFKNYIINGKKQINQRGLTSTDNSYNQDRWYKVGNNWYQGIEGDNNLINGKTYTLSWVGNATASYYVGNATSTTINSQSFTTISNGGSFTLTISAGQNIWVKFVSDGTGTTFNFVQLEEGSVATPFEQRPYGLELSLCQRYYAKSYSQSVVPGSATNVGQFTSAGIPSNTGFYGTSQIRLPVTMRATPTTSIWNYGGTANQWFVGQNGVSETSYAASTNGLSDSGFAVVLSGVSTVSSYNVAYGHWTVSAEL